MSDDFIFRGPVGELDPELTQILAREEARQASTIILIASESEAPEAVSEALTSVFGNIYAEGYPREESRKQTQAEILDLDMELAHYRRYSDPRYYKGVEYADVLEALTRRRAAELFAANGINADNLFVNVQPLSGAPANSAVYTAMIQPGDTILGLNLNDGGHLTHGAPVNRSGQGLRALVCPTSSMSRTETRLRGHRKAGYRWNTSPRSSSPATPPIPRSSTGSASARSPTRWELICWPTLPTSPAW